MPHGVLPRPRRQLADAAPALRTLIDVAPYDSEWPHRFAAERELLERVLAPWLESGIHHVGSTAIPGIAAKPIIDMVAGIRDLEEARAAFEPLSKHSYIYTPHRPHIAHHRLAQEHPDDVGAYTAGKREVIARMRAGVGVQLPAIRVRE